MVWYGLDSFGSGCAHVLVSCEHVIEPLGSIRCMKFLDYLKDCACRHQQ